MTPQEKNILSHYAHAKIVAREVDSTVNLLKDEVIIIVNKYTGGEVDDNLKINEGSYTVSSRRKYEYPDEVKLQIKDLESQIEAIKTISEQKGEGTYIETLSVIFKQSKENEHGTEGDH